MTASLTYENIEDHPIEGESSALERHVTCSDVNAKYLSRDDIISSPC